jgi:hypothetical protein
VTTRKRLPPFLYRSKRTPLLLLVLAFLGLVLTPLAHAGTYVGYGASNCSTNPCFKLAFTDHYGVGETVQAPFAGTLVSAGVYAADSSPTKLIVLTSSQSVTGFNAGCNAQACGSITDNTFTFTVQDSEALSLGANTFSTVNLVNPVTVTSGQFVALVVVGTTGGACNASTCISQFDNGGSVSILSTCFNFATNNPGIGNTYTARSTASSGDGNCNATYATILGGSFNPTNSGSSGGVIATQCYGNCGNPPITLANTNSTHTINFNQSITLLYEFQSNLNGFVKNYTLNYAQVCGSGNKCVANTLSMGLYTIPSCPLGQTPFSPQCPGLRVSQGSVSPPTKSRISFVASSVQVSNGQWVGVTVSATFTGIDVNDTNTNVNLFQTNEGNTPPSISQAVPVAGVTSKMGAWVWITGNIVTGSSSPNPNNFNCPGFLDCLVPSWVSSFCFNGTPTCLGMSALVWAGILGFVSTFFVVKYGSEIMPGQKIPFGEIFLFFGLTWIFVMAGLSLTFAWIPVFFFFLISILMRKNVGSYL